MTVASVNGTTCLRARVQIPAWGVWWADVDLPGEVSLAGSVVVSVADLSLSGTVKSGGSANGRSAYRIAGGAGAWGTTLPAKAYVNDGGVKRTNVAQDAANECGEVLDTTGLSGTLGTAYVREAGAASWALEYVSPQAWYVDEQGITRIGARAAVAVDTSAARVRVDPAAGVIVLASEEIGQLLPGATVDGMVAVDVQHEVSAEAGLRTTLWSSLSRATAFQKLVRQAIDPRWLGTYEYRIVTQEGERLSLQPVLSSLGLPSVRRVRVRPGIPGVKASHRLGSLVLVTFVNADRARPVIVAFDDCEAPGFLPLTLTLDAATSITLGSILPLPVARTTDAVQAGIFTGAITSGSLKVRSD